MRDGVVSDILVNGKHVYRFTYIPLVFCAYSSRKDNSSSFREVCVILPIISLFYFFGLGKFCQKLFLIEGHMQLQSICISCDIYIYIHCFFFFEKQLTDNLTTNIPSWQISKLNYA